MNTIKCPNCGPQEEVKAVQKAYCFSTYDVEEGYHQEYAQELDHAFETEYECFECEADLTTEMRESFNSLSK